MKAKDIVRKHQTIVPQGSSTSSYIVVRRSKEEGDMAAELYYSRYIATYEPLLGWGAALYHEDSGLVNATSRLTKDEAWKLIDSWKEEYANETQG